MAEVILKDVCKMYDGGVLAVKHVDLEIKDREFMVLVGPSGCGKSTTLRMIAGLEEITSGELWIDGQLCNYVEAKDRDLSMVFQNYALYPNMTVYENMAFSLKIRKQPKDEVDKKVHEAAKMLGIEHLLDRRPSALSGGQKQRISIARVFLKNPSILIFDEATSALDNQSEALVQESMERLCRDRTTIIIAHRLSTVKNADYIYCLRGGKLVEHGTHQELLALDGYYKTLYTMHTF